MRLPTKEELIKALKRYDEVLQLRQNSSKSKGLEDLDRFRQRELPKVLSTRKDGHLTSSELVRLMEWKIAHGKWRPRIIQLVSSNPNEEVIKVTKSAYSQSDPIKSLDELCKLKGIGPAGGSLILSIWMPNDIVYLLDEYSQVLGLGKPDYTKKFWVQLGKSVKAKVKEDGWSNLREFENACWSWGNLNKLVDGDEDVKDSSTKKKRGRGDVDDKGSKSKRKRT